LAIVELPLVRASGKKGSMKYPLAIAVNLRCGLNLTQQIVKRDPPHDVSILAQAMPEPK
jgi:hypothetical protein